MRIQGVVSVVVYLLWKWIGSVFDEHETHNIDDVPAHITSDKHVNT